MRIACLSITLLCLFLFAKISSATEQAVTAKRDTANKSPIYQVLASAIATRNQGQVNDAISALNNALTLYPNQRQLQFELGSLYLEKGDHALAKQYFDICSNDKTITPRMRQALLLKLSQLPAEETLEQNQVNTAVAPKKYHISQSLTVATGYDSQPKVSSFDVGTSLRDLKNAAFSVLPAIVISNSDYDTETPPLDASKPSLIFSTLDIRNSHATKPKQSGDQYQNANYQLNHLYGLPNKFLIKDQNAKLFLLSRFKISKRQYQTIDHADLGTADLNTSLILKLGTRFRASAELGVRRNESSNQHLATVIQFKPQLRWINTNSKFTLGMTARDVAYKENGYKDFNGMHVEFDAAYRWQLNQNSAINFGMSFGEMDRAQTYLSYQSFSYHVTAQHQFSFGTHLSIGARYSKRDYNAAPKSSDQLVDLSAISESPLLLIGQLSQPINKYLEVDLRYVHFQQRANYKSLEREQYRFEFGLKLKL